MKINVVGLIAFAVLLTARCFAGLGNDDSWWNGSLGPAPPTPTGTPVYRYPIYAPRIYAPPAPTKEELEAKDLAESSEYYTDKGNDWYRAGKWESAIAFYQKALRENADNDEARDNLKKAQKHLRDELDREAEEQRRVIAEAQRRFVEQRDASLLDNRRYHQGQVERLMHEADHLKVPLPGGAIPRHIHEGILLGLMDPQDEADAKLSGAGSPFTGRPYEAGAIFATASSSNAAAELMRGLLDNQTDGAFTLSTPAGRALVERLNGTSFDRLIAHSNGGTVAEALIRDGVIKVDELNVVGADRSLVNQAGYQNLIDSGLVKRVVVWINPGDPVPVGSSMAYVTPMGRVNMAPLLTSAEHAAFALTGERKGGDARVEYRLLSGPGYVGQNLHTDQSMFQPHDLKSAYFPNIATFFSKTGRETTQQ